MSYSGESPDFVYLVDLEIIVANRAHVAAAALFVYDTLLTFPQEVNHVWGRQFSGTTLLYFVNRYCLLAQKVLIILEVFPWQSISARSCTVVSWLNEILIVITFLVISAFFALRVYAILDRRWALAVVIFVIGSVLPTIGLYQQATITSTIIHAPVLGFVICNDNSTIPVGTYSILATTCRVATAASDLLVLIVTLTKTFKIRRMASEHNVRTPLISLLLRDGSLYFAAIFTFNLADIILLQVIAFGAVADFVTTLSVILISRFMLNLRDFYISDSEASGSSRTEFSSVRFTDVLVGTLGAPLVHGEPENDQEREGMRQRESVLQEFVQGSSSA